MGYASAGRPQRTSKKCPAAAVMTMRNEAYTARCAMSALGGGPGGRVGYSSASSIASKTAFTFWLVIGTRWPVRLMKLR